jgi:hypothetical protein
MALHPLATGSREDLRLGLGSWAIEGGDSSGKWIVWAGPVRLASLRRIETNRRPGEELMRGEVRAPPSPLLRFGLSPASGGTAITWTWRPRAIA